MDPLHRKCPHLAATCLHSLGVLTAFIASHHLLINNRYRLNLGVSLVHIDYHCFLHRRARRLHPIPAGRSLPRRPRLRSRTSGSPCNLVCYLKLSLLFSYFYSRNSLLNAADLEI